MAARWAPGFGDNDLVGWLTVGGYVLAALACLAAAAAERSPGVRIGQRASVSFWGMIAALLLVLGANKQLDLQSLLTQLARDSAKYHGWYDQRRPIQIAFIVMVICSGTAVLIASLKVFWHGDMVRRIALCGATCLYIYVACRAASFHHVEVALAAHAMVTRLYRMFELTGIIVIAAAALVAAGRNGLGTAHSHSP